MRAETKTLTYFIVKPDSNTGSRLLDVMTLFPGCNNQPDHQDQLQHPPTTTTNEVIWENLKWSLVPSSHAIHHLLVTSHQRWNDLSISSISRNNLIMHVKILDTECCSLYLELYMHDQVLMLHCVIILASEAHN